MFECPAGVTAPCCKYVRQGPLLADITKNRIGYSRLGIESPFLSFFLNSFRGFKKAETGTQCTKLVQVRKSDSDSTFLSL